MAQVAKFCIKLDWKAFNVDLTMVNDWMNAHVGTHYCGNQAASQLELWFTDTPSQEDQDAAKAYWESLHEESDEAISYTPMADLITAKEAKKASGKAKLLALGLTEDEVNAILG